MQILKCLDNAIQNIQNKNIQSELRHIGHLKLKCLTKLFKTPHM